MPRSVPIGGYGEPWHVCISPRLKTLWGYCDYEKRTIVLSKAADKHGVERETLLHEVIHKICPWLNEDAVLLLAKELDDALDACGH